MAALASSACAEAPVRPAAVQPAIACAEPTILPASGASKQEDIARMMKVLDFESMSDAVMAETARVTRNIYPDLPDGFYDLMKANFSSAFMREFAIPLYDKYFTHEEVLALLDFYSRPVGQGLLKKMPALMGESMMNGAQWGRLFAQREVNRWQAEHTHAAK